MFVLVVIVGISWYLMFGGGRIAQVANVKIKGDVWLGVRQCDAGNATNGVGFSYWRPCQGRALEQWSEFGFWRLASWGGRKKGRNPGKFSQSSWLVVDQRSLPRPSSGDVLGRRGLGQTGASFMRERQGTRPHRGHSVQSMEVASPSMSGSGACPSLPVLKAVPDHVLLPEAGAADWGNGKAEASKPGLEWSKEGAMQVQVSRPLLLPEVVFR
ncbi:hypothetical protein CKAH01_05895 [Colletotrichum kahawae]|uniref:Uncharacterized protein n=1 Tax=Colletotrichum kahawae TaxID=34407 RepID=A0AAD9YDM2_COLKA|nr:hypothetical protein CKAH01_05895 [Colletotrichum kahawae]